MCVWLHTPHPQPDDLGETKKGSMFYKEQSQGVFFFSIRGGGTQHGGDLQVNAGISSSLPRNQKLVKSKAVLMAVVCERQRVAITEACPGFPGLFFTSTAMPVAFLLLPDSNEREKTSVANALLFSAFADNSFAAGNRRRFTQGKRGKGGILQLFLVMRSPNEACGLIGF